ncbi:MAG: DNA helicase RecQ [Clostridia bacterium]|nr:DNA helicase RecQ [Clostridia bacterium]
MDKYQVLKKYFGYSEFRNGQAEIIDAIVSGKDAVGIMPTGGGKSICFQVPALMFQGVSIIISPLISLMKDQVNALKACGVNAAFFNSTLNESQIKRERDKVLEGKCKIIYVAPERLSSPSFNELCSRLEISMVCIDEAHCVSQWGQDFRPSYLDIKDFIRTLPKRPVVAAFTATATKRVREDICSLLGLNEPEEVVTGFARDNLYFEVVKTADKYTALKRYLDLYSSQSGIVYCATKKAVDEVCSRLNDEGFSVTRYHAGLSKAERTDNQNKFIYDEKQIVVATNAFGMGIDKSNVSFVIHYNMPGDIESYYQEAGRAGRDGSDANCVILYSPQDVRIQKFFIENSEYKGELTFKQKMQLKNLRIEKLEKMIYYCENDVCLRNYILRYFDENPTSKCGNCSNCKGVTQTIDVTVPAQMIFSCIKRVEEKESLSVIADILKGEKTPYIEEKDYDSLSTFAIMADSAKSEIIKHIEYFIEHSFVSRGSDGTLYLEKKTREVLFKGKKVRKIIEKQAIKQAADIMSTDLRLLVKLKLIRKIVARSAGMPDFVIFTDKTLEAMAKYKPKDLKELLKLPGITMGKAEKYGKHFIEAIKKNLSENVQK